MPPKSVTCSVCNESVLKAQTLARADGSRACRTHEGVTAEAETLQAAERAKLDKAIEKTERPWKGAPDYGTPFYNKEAEEFRDRVHNTCWTCDERGVSMQEFYANALVAIKRLELRGEFNFDTLPEDVGKLVNERRALAALKLKDEAIDKAVVKHVRNSKIRDLVPVFRFVHLCAQCAIKHGFKQRWDDLLPKPTFEQIENMLPVVAAIDPLLVELAEKKERQS